MIIAEWSFNVPKEKLEEFLGYSKEILKPFWKAHGAVSYSAYQCFNKQYFRYQESNNETRIVEHIYFKNIKNLENFLKISKENKNTEEYKMQKSYESKFNVTNTIFRIYREI